MPAKCLQRGLQEAEKDNTTAAYTSNECNMPKWNGVPEKHLGREETGIGVLSTRNDQGYGELLLLVPYHGTGRYPFYNGSKELKEDEFRILP